ETIASAIGPLRTSLTWVDNDFLKGQGVDGNALPLWPSDPDEQILGTAGPAKAYAAGLEPRPLVDTVLDIHGYLSSLAEPPQHDGQLSRKREAELLQAWDSR